MRFKSVGDMPVGENSGLPLRTGFESGQRTDEPGQEAKLPSDILAAMTAIADRGRDKDGSGQRVAIARKCFGYARYSSINGHESSIERQVEKINAYAAEHGYVLTKIFTDRGVSGTVWDRNGLNQLMAELEASPGGTVIVEAMDRLTRSMEAWCNIFIPLHAFGAELHETSTGLVDELMGPIKAAMAGHDRKNIVDRLRKHRETIARQGGWIGGNPYGYHVKNKQLVLEENDYRIGVVREAFDRKFKGDTLGNIARSFNERGIPAPADTSPVGRRPLGGRSGRWSRTAVRRMLLNTKYAGYLVYPTLGIVTEKPELRIVSPTVFLKVKADLDRAAELRRGRRYSNRRKFWLTGRLRCSCGKALAIIALRDGDREFACRSRRIEWLWCGNGTAYSLRGAEVAVLGMVADLLDTAKNRVDFLALLESNQRKMLDEAFAMRKHCDGEIKRRDAELDNLARNIETMSQQDPRFAGRAMANVTRLEDELEEVRKQRALLQSPENFELLLTEDLPSLRSVLQTMIERAPFVPTNADEQRAVDLLRSLVRSVRIQPKDDETIDLEVDFDLGLPQTADEPSFIRRTANLPLSKLTYGLAARRSSAKRVFHDEKERLTREELAGLDALPGIRDFFARYKRVTIETRHLIFDTLVLQAKHQLPAQPMLEEWASRPLQIGHLTRRLRHSDAMNELKAALADIRPGVEFSKLDPARPLTNKLRKRFATVGHPILKLTLAAPESGPDVRITDEQWRLLAPLLKRVPSLRNKGGYSRLSYLRRALDAVFFAIRMDVSMANVPLELPRSTPYRTIKILSRTGALDRVVRTLLAAEGKTIRGPLPTLPPAYKDG